MLNDALDKQRFLEDIEKRRKEDTEFDIRCSIANITGIANGICDTTKMGMVRKDAINLYIVALLREAEKMEKRLKEYQTEKVKDTLRSLEDYSI